MLPEKKERVRQGWEVGSASLSLVHELPSKRRRKWVRERKRVKLLIRYEPQHRYRGTEGETEGRREAGRQAGERKRKVGQDITSVKLKIYTHNLLFSSSHMSRI